MINMTRIIVIEGADKSGKETQSKLLKESSTKKIKRIEVPFNDCFTYRLIYWMLYSGYAKRLPATFQFIQFMNKFIFQCFVLPWHLFMNDVVVFDRWSLSSVVYGMCESLSPWYVYLLDSFLIEPHVTIVLNGKSYKRKEKSDSYEKDTGLQTMVKHLYKQVSDGRHKNIISVSNDASIEAVHENIKKVLKVNGIEL